MYITLRFFNNHLITIRPQWDCIICMLRHGIGSVTLRIFFFTRSSIADPEFVSDLWSNPVVETPKNLSGPISLPLPKKESCIILLCLQSLF